MSGQQLALQIPKSFHPTIIGRGGETIRQLQATHGCDIHVPARDSPSNAVLLTGSPQSIQAAHRAINQLLHFTASTDPLLTASFTLSGRYYGQLIGPGGQTLKSLEGETGSSITIPGRDSGSEVVSVQGSRESVDRALRRMQELTGQPINPSFQNTTIEAAAPAAANYTPAPATNQRQQGSNATSTKDAVSNIMHQVETRNFGGLFSSVTSLVKDLVHDKSSSSSTPSSQPVPQRQQSFSLPAVDLSSAGEINEVLFFPNDTSVTPSSFDRFLQYVRSARHTIDTAIYTIS